MMSATSTFRSFKLIKNILPLLAFRRKPLPFRVLPVFVEHWPLCHAGWHFWTSVHRSLPWKQTVLQSRPPFYRGLHSSYALVQG